MEDLPSTNMRLNTQQIDEYFQRILQAARTLAKVPPSTHRLDPAASTVEIASLLLKACQRLDGDTNDLPNKTVQPENTKIYVRRRVDYLRELLRALAPISWHVAAQVCTILQPDTEIPVTMRQAAVVLFSQWLPIACHLTPLVSDLFQSEHFHTPLTGNWNAEEILVLEACFNIVTYFRNRQESHLYRQWWDWSLVFAWLEKLQDSMEVDEGEDSMEYRAKWYAARIAGLWLDVSKPIFRDYLVNNGVSDDLVSFQMHLWTRAQEEADFQDNQVEGLVSVWNKDTFAFPVVPDIESLVPLDEMLVSIGSGYIFYRHGGLLKGDSGGQAARPQLIPSETTSRNLSRLALVLGFTPYPPPILVCGPAGSGKSSLVRELTRLFNNSDNVGDHLLEIHVDEETDVKTLVGSYTSTEIPGEFEWRPGALTRAVRGGKWVLIEDLNRVPVELQSSLIQLFENRLLPLGNGKTEHCHPNFRIFATLAIEDEKHRDNDRGVFEPTLWHKVHLDSLPLVELRQIAESLYPSVPGFIVDAALEIYSSLSRTDGDSSGNNDTNKPIPLTIGKPPSIRDLFKVFHRISSCVEFEPGTEYATESQRTLCLAETFDVFVSSCPDVDLRMQFLERVAVRAWGVSLDLATSYIHNRRPPVEYYPTYTTIGRARISLPSNRDDALEDSGKNNFVQTSFALRLMEMVGVCVAHNEPVLLVGETGCGKTSLLQNLAIVSGRELVVQNLSLQTDSTDLLGGFRPLEIKQIARKFYNEFVDLFTATFSRKQNADFLLYAAKVLRQEDWVKVSQCFRRAAKLGLAKVQERGSSESVKRWKSFHEASQRFEQQRLAQDTGLAFVFSEGILVDAILNGKWVLLDEINLASSETLQRLVGLLDDTSSSITLTERGDSSALVRHPDFRLFAAMNPATDSGKKDLPNSVRARFTEVYVDELQDKLELRLVAARYLSRVLPVGVREGEHSECAIRVVDLYLKCREAAELNLQDGGGHKPRYTLRTLARALAAADSFVLEQRLPLDQSLYEGFAASFQGPLSLDSLKMLDKIIRSSLLGTRKKYSAPKPSPESIVDGVTVNYVLVESFWLKRGEYKVEDWSKESSGGCARFVLVPSSRSNLLRLARAVASGPWPVLLEGPTSAGKTTLIEYLAALCGHRAVRINNHEHTDIQEYTGGFASDSNGGLSFQEGLLVEALRNGYWVILDELNLAPSEVLEALNRLLDDNRELYIPETNETVQPHPHFRLFATQNPSGVYGGRKPLSRAFRNRFLELQLGDIPNSEMVTILEQRSGCPPSHAKSLVAVMDSLRNRRSKNSVFLGKDGFVTPRDLLRWAGRGASSKQELAEEGCMILAERLRSKEEKEFVCDEISKHLKVSLDIEELYYGNQCQARKLLEQLKSAHPGNRMVHSVAPTRTLLRVMTIVLRCINNKEPVLLVGETGCGKTTVVQLLSMMWGSNLHIINCHATTETADLLGSLRPVRGRSEIIGKMRELFQSMTMNLGERCIDDMRANSFDSILSATKELRSKYVDLDAEERESKRPKVESANSESCTDWQGVLDNLESIEKLAREYRTLFEWSDGPLVRCMKEGEMLLLDEMSLAEDAVLERLNSVLEPSRTLVLAEKPAGNDSESRVVVANESFQLFATMNPGGDFGKRELSPALRSRFTEIWVPTVTDHADLTMVVEQSLTSLPSDLRSNFCNRMVNYFEWFNGPVCSDPGSPCMELSLSIRDMLAWSTFVVEVLGASPQSCPWTIFYHGACLMHLDGLGLGTALGKDAVDSTRKKASAWLLDSLPINSEHLANPDVRFRAVSGSFGSDLFRIPLGPAQLIDSRFDFNAPTTSINVSRVLRAMQISKPILLEGSPGVGKTRLCEALAAASGHKLTRINLSDQTDIADLFGSDLPVPSENGQDTAQFRWCDGIFLSALKSGEWVLLDELNLASQSVLEGLNSCLDHRASVFIPELGLTYDCPPTFRVFAAQNPLGQGGGRKGLPKSFLNRFTKVFVDALSPEDMSAIIRTRFNRLPDEVAQAMVAFNGQLVEDVVDQRKYGQSGSPWEFNLRDIFRWCELLEASTVIERLPSEYGRDLYFQRFRSSFDREQMLSCYPRIDGEKKETMLRTNISVHATTTDMTLDDVKLSRLSTFDGVRDDQGLISLTLGQLLPITALARCVSMNWPCLLVAKRDQTNVVEILAAEANAKVIDVCLSPSSDVSELVGCFEQSSPSDAYSANITELCSLARQSLAGRPSKVMAELVQKIAKQPHGSSASEAKRLVALLDRDSVLEPSDVERLDQLDIFFQSFTKANEKNGQFVWKDGVLVDAMKAGYWLHLRNSNLCPASVLDRLNPVLEPNGFLLMAESGPTDGQNGHRKILPHPSFRIILSMNPEHGEVSRAMRNRCVELSIPDTSLTSDKIGVPRQLVTRKVYSSKIFSGLCQLSEDSMNLLHSASLFSRCLQQGVPASLHIQLFNSDGWLRQLQSMPITVVHDGLWSAELETVLRLSCYLQWFSAEEENVLRVMNDMEVLDTPSSIIHFETFSFHMMSLWLRRAFKSKSVLSGRRFLQGLENDRNHRVEHAFECLDTYLAVADRELDISRVEFFFKHLHIRLLLREWKYLAVESQDDMSGKSVMDICFLLEQELLDRSSVPCQLTSSLLPFGLALMGWADELCHMAMDNRDLLHQLQFLMIEITGFFFLLQQLQYDPNRSGLVPFEEVDFIVNWQWLTKTINVVASLRCSGVTEGTKHAMVRHHEMIIAKKLFNGKADSELLRSFSELGRRCCVPTKQEGWSCLLSLRKMSESFCPWEAFSSHIQCDANDILSVKTLVEKSHPAIFVQQAEKRHLLKALCTAFSSVTSESGNFTLAVDGDVGGIIVSSANDRLQQLERSWQLKLAKTKYSGDSVTVTVAFSVDDLEVLRDATDSHSRELSNTMRSILEGFAMIQISPCYETWTMEEERGIVRLLCKLLMEEESMSLEVRGILLESTRKFVRTCLERTVLSVADIRPFQTLAWLLETTSMTEELLRDHIQRLLPTMLSVVHMRVWSTKFQHFTKLCPRLEMPSLVEEKAKTLLAPASLLDHVPVATIQTFVSTRYNLATGGIGHVPFSTLENHSIRSVQADRLAEAICMLSHQQNDVLPFDLLYLLNETFLPLSNFFDETVYSAFLAKLCSPAGILNLKAEEIDAFLSCCSNEDLVSLLRPTLSSLIGGLRHVFEVGGFGSESDEGLSYILLGLIRYHLYLPASPIDPASTPSAHVRLLSHRLTLLNVEKLSRNIDARLAVGFVDELDYTMEIRNEQEILNSRILEAQKKQVERIPTDHSFYDFFRDVHEMAGRHLSVDTVQGLVNQIRGTGEAFERLQNWGSVMSAFCSTLSKKFVAFEEHLSPLIEAVSMIQVGLGMLAERNSPRKIPDTTVFSLASVPSTPDIVNLNEVLKTAMKLLCETSRLYSLTSAALSLVVYNRRVMMSSAAIEAWIQLSRTFTYDSENDAPPDQIDESEEAQLLELFPNYYSDFKNVRDSDGDGAVLDQEEELVEEEAPQRKFSADLIELLCQRHREMFAVSPKSLSDPQRYQYMNEACRGYLTLGHLDNSPLLPKHDESNDIWALATASPNHGTTFGAEGLHRCFHLDSNPAEVSRASEPLSVLHGRAHFLLNAFPDHDILLSIITTVDRIKKFDISVVPLGKVMTGLEIVLRHAQDWEQHASQHVKLGDALNGISTVVASWRRLELSSWSALLNSREERYNRKARRHWGRLHSLLSRTPEVLRERQENASNVEAPRWLLKTSKRLQIAEVPVLGEASNSVQELLRLLDTFILTAPLGESIERILILGSFASQLKTETGSFVSSTSQIVLARTVLSLWKYYSQYETFLQSQVQQLRAPFEKRLREEAKLAKWDEQSYYSLAESTQRNYQKLMRILREYDEALEINVGLLLEKEANKGLREDGESSHVALIPGNGTLFPFTTIMVPISHEDVDLAGPRPSMTDSTKITEKVLLSIPKYAKKMTSMRQRQISKDTSLSTRGSCEVRELCAAIFERIDTLRSTKTTRPMKERALSDLLKELKEQGYATTKWSAPKETEGMLRLFELPTPSLDDTTIQENHRGPLFDIESYFQRSLAESHRLHSEASTFGSSHMTARQIAIFSSIVNHGSLLLGQQRTLLTSLLEDRRRLHSFIGLLSSSNVLLPSGQVGLSTHTSSLLSHVSISSEILARAKMIVLARHHLSMTDTRGWCEDTATRLSSLSEKISSYRDTPLLQSSVVTKEALTVVSEIRIAVDDCLLAISGLEGESAKTALLPKNLLEECTKALEATRDCTSRCLEEQEPLSHDTSPSSFIPALKTAVSKALIFTQEVLVDDSQVNTDEATTDGIWELHKRTMESWLKVRVSKLTEAIQIAVDELRQETEKAGREEEIDTFGSLLQDGVSLYKEVLKIIDMELGRLISFHRETSKLQYVLIRIFRTLVAKGYCSAKDSETDGEGDTSGMTFEDDVDGTGMGEGEGKADVTDHLENEEQLLGLKDDENNAEETPNDSKQLDEEEAETGMEMEANFDGELYDVPDEADKKDQPSGDEDETEELDREMGDEMGPDDEVVDEKLWDESDDEGDGNQDQEEKLEKDNEMQGANASDEMTTKEDEGGDQKPGENAGGDQDQQEEEKSGDEMVNDDFEENYEENHGLDVRDDRQTPEDPEMEEDMQLDDDLKMDDNEEGDEGDKDGSSVDDESPIAEDETPEVEPPTNDDASVTSIDGEDEAQDGVAQLEEDQPENSEASPTDDGEPPQHMAQEKHESMEGLGVQAQDGNDAVQGDPEASEEQQEQTEGDGEEGGNDNADQEIEEESPDGATSGNQQGDNFTGGMESSSSQQQQKQQEEAPNPFRDPGDASHFWHRRLNVMQSEATDEQEPMETNDQMEESKVEQGEFEYVGKNQEATTQTLGEVDENQATELQDEKPEDDIKVDQANTAESTEDPPKAQESQTKSERRQKGRMETSDQDNAEEPPSTEADEDKIEQVDDPAPEGQDDDDDDAMETDEVEPVSSTVVSDLSRLNVEDGSKDQGVYQDLVVDEGELTPLTEEALLASRTQWSTIASETYGLSRRLCEKLRLVLEPLVASKLRGDYRTGKRINMKRVIPYIASGYRKDKIWLRRTKPAKRNYRVLVAVDDSESMQQSGHVALQAMATLATGMSQLEVGQVGVAKFGNEMELLHDFYEPFTAESGANLVRQFGFDQSRTRTALCVQSAMEALEEGDSCMQLVFLISDGRIERDSRATLRRLIRDMMERNILIAMVIVQNGKESITNMQQVSFEKGKPVVKRFMDDYPFPYFIVLEDLEELPEVLGDALRQWFEMLSQLQGGR